MKKKLETIEQRYNVESDNYLKEFEARVDAQREQVKNNLKLAIEAMIQIKLWKLMISLHN